MVECISYVLKSSTIPVSPEANVTNCVLDFLLLALHYEEELLVIGDVLESERAEPHSPSCAHKYFMTLTMLTKHIKLALAI